MMKKALIWNIRSVRTQQAFHRLQMLHKHHQFSIIGLMETFQNAREIQTYKRRLNMNQAGANINGKIWFFVKEDVQVKILQDAEQQITLKLMFLEDSISIITTLVYAKCDKNVIIQLWDHIYQLANNMTIPWLVGGDFNVVLNEEEKIGGIPITVDDTEDFATCVNSSELHDVGFKDSPFICWNGKMDKECIFERLDRVLVNQHLQDTLGYTEVEHLSRIGSDHAPLLVSLGGQNSVVKKPFRFLQFWMEHKDFLRIV